MSDKPNLLQRQSLGNLINLLESDNSQLKGYFRDAFEGWEPICDSGISDYDYFRTLKDFPLYAKRFIIQSVLQGWNIHHDLITLKEGLGTLIYLKLCAPAEYFFMQIVYNCISSFGETLDDIPYIEIESHRVTKYCVRFWKDNTISRDTYGIIDFELHESDKEPALAVVPWTSLLRNVFNFKEKGEYENLDEDEFDYYTRAMNESDLLYHEWAKDNCPWIQSYWKCGCRKEPYNRGIVFLLHSLEYWDSNLEDRSYNLKQEKVFSFYIPAESYTYSFSLPFEKINGGVFVCTSNLRHPMFSVSGETATNTDFASLGSALISAQSLQEYGEFKRDLGSYVNKIIETRKKITHEILLNALLGVCKEHIDKCGRLLFSDLLGYADLSTCVDEAIYKASLISYHDFYKNSVYLVLNTYPNEVLFPDTLGGFHSWAEKQI